MNNDTDKYRLGIVTKTGRIFGINISSKEEADDYILNLAGKEGIKQYRLIDRQTGELIDKGNDL